MAGAVAADNSPHCPNGVAICARSWFPRWHSRRHPRTGWRWTRPSSATSGMARIGGREAILYEGVVVDAMGKQVLFQSFRRGGSSPPQCRTTTLPLMMLSRLSSTVTLVVMRSRCDTLWKIMSMDSRISVVKVTAAKFPAFVLGMAPPAAANFRMPSRTAVIS